MELEDHGVVVCWSNGGINSNGITPLDMYIHNNNLHTTIGVMES